MSLSFPGDRRQLPRAAGESCARLTILREYGPGGDMSVTVTECTGVGMKLVAPHHLTPGEAVRVDVADSLLLGEVVNTAQMQDTGTSRRWVVGIKFEQGIFGLAALQKLLAAIAGEEGDRRRPPVSPAPIPNSGNSERSKTLDQRECECSGKQEEKSNTHAIHLTAPSDPSA